MNERKKTRLFAIAFAICALAFIGWGFWRKWQIVKSHKIGIGKIYRYTYGGRGHAGRFFVDFRTTIDGREYTGSSTYLMEDFNCNDDFIGKTFPVVYSPEYHSISSMLIIPSDFARYNYPYPDSLNWVKKYIK
jgi:hypothetical protein